MKKIEIQFFNIPIQDPNIQQSIISFPQHTHSEIIENVENINDPKIQQYIESKTDIHGILFTKDNKDINKSNIIKFDYSSMFGGIILKEI